MRIRYAFAISVLWLGVASLSQAETRYDPLRAGHPLRIAAYALHPVGVILDRLVFRPAWVLGQHEPLRTLFGVTPDLEAREASSQLREAPRSKAPESQKR